MFLSQYQALLLVSFGGPEGPGEVLPFLENVLRGKHVPRERMLEVAEHYRHFGGISPINAQLRALKAALEVDFRSAGLDLPIYWGNRNWRPFLSDTLREMRELGVRHALAFFTSAFSSYSSCRQYLENIAQAQEQVGPGAPQIDKLRAYFNHPGFIEAWVDRAREALAQATWINRAKARIIFTAHSIPQAMAAHCRYSEQLLEASRLVAEALEIPPERWQLVYQSRSGPLSQPWLGPDINDHLRTLASKGVAEIVVVPIGFISDHMEVLYDLDIEARRTAEQLGLRMIRAATVGTHPRFVRMIRELIVERLTDASDRPALGVMGPSHDECRSDCCLSGRPES